MSDRESELLDNPDSPPSENEAPGGVSPVRSRQQRTFTIGRGSRPNELVGSQNVVSRKASKRSIVWQFWEHTKGTTGDVNKALVQCKLCGIKKKFQNTTTVLMDHLKRSHYNALFSASSSSTTTPEGLSKPGPSCSTGTSSAPHTIDSYFKRANKYKRPSKKSDDIDRARGAKYYL